MIHVLYFMYHFLSGELKFLLSIREAFTMLGSQLQNSVNLLERKELNYN